MDKVVILKECVDKITKDAYKFFEKNNKAAGVRARKKLQKCKKYAQEIRNLIQKSKQELVQKKAAAAANAAALNTDKFIECLGAKTNENNLDSTKKDFFEKYNSEFPNFNESHLNFTRDCMTNFDLAKTIPSSQEHSRIESLPSLNGDHIDIFR